MSDFLHRLAGDLRAREKFLEDHNDHPVFDSTEGNTLRADYEDLLDRVKALAGRVETARSKGEPYDESLRETLHDAERTLTVEIEAWSSGLKDE